MNSLWGIIIIWHFGVVLFTSYHCFDVLMQLVYFILSALDPLPQITPGDRRPVVPDHHDDDEVMLNVLGCRLTY